MSLTGGCQCGAVRYRIAGEPLGFARCHCTDCQKQSGSAFGLSLYVRSDDIEITGELAEWRSRAASGKEVIRRFCPACGVRIMHVSASGADYVSIKGGTLDPGHGLEPQAELWTASRLPWVQLIEGVPQWEGQPPSHDALRRSWAAWRSGRTLAFYDTHAADYADWSEPEAEPPRLAAFLDKLAPGARVLDLGCGTGWAAAKMGQRGFRVRAMDGSRGLAAQAKLRHGIDVEIAEFTDFNEFETLDAIWAFFSLLHAPRDRMPRHLSACSAALAPGGRLYLGLKAGTGSSRDPQDRLYTYYDAEELRALVRAAGFRDITLEHGAGKNYDGSPTENLYLEALRG